MPTSAPPIEPPFPGGSFSRLERPQPANPKVEYLSGGRIVQGAPARILPREFDDAVRKFGSRLYDFMLTDPAVHAAIETLKQGVLRTGPTLMAPDSAQADPAKTAEEQDPDVALAAEVLASCQRMVDRFSAKSGPFVSLAYECLDMLAQGVVLAEPTWEIVPDGEDQGRLSIAEIHPKPADVWAFVVDRRMHVIGIYGYYDPDAEGIAAGEQSGWRVFDPEHFLIFSWLRKRGDPRGQSLLRAAYEPWNEKVQNRPKRFAFLSMFGRPKVVLVLPEQGESLEPTDAAGHVIPDAPRIPPEEQARTALAGFEDGSFLICPYGSAITLVEAKGDGEAFSSAMDHDNREIMLAIIQNARTLMEAEHGSKADSGTGQDVTRQFEGFIGSLLGSAFKQQVFYPYVRDNWGKDVADRVTPDVVFQSSAEEDFAANAEAVASLMTAGFIAEDQKPFYDVHKLGVQPRDPEAARKEAELKQKTAELAANPPAPAPAPEPGKAPAKDPGKPAPKPEPKPARK